MAVGTQYTPWQTMSPGKPYTGTSPNLLALHDWLVANGFTSMGRNGYVVRPIRGGTAWSTHAFGAALDIRWTDREIALDRAEWLIGWSHELGIQRIHDYYANRYWQAGRGWIGRPPGTGVLDSFHIEVTAAAWTDGRSVEERTGKTPATTPPSQRPKYPGRPLKLGSGGPNVKLVQQVVGAAPDGKFGPKTESLVAAWQTKHGLLADGIVGPLTWRAMFQTA